MTPKLTVALLTFAGTLVSSLVSAKIVPSAMTTMTWVDTFYTVGLQAALMALGTLVVATDPVRRTLRLR